MKKIDVLSIQVILALMCLLFIFYCGRSIIHLSYGRIAGRRTVSDVMAIYRYSAEKRLWPYFDAAGIAYPPRKVAILALKEERILELWGKDMGRWHYIRSYPIMAASGRVGPKLREGDMQVPEGLYGISGLNPNSSYHLSMKIGYPNEFDLYHARKEGRDQPGGDIFIHGKSISSGCIAMGDRAIEEIFVLVANVGRENTQVLIAPCDPRIRPLEGCMSSGPSWLPDLYNQIEDEFNRFQRIRRPDIRRRKLHSLTDNLSS